MDGLPTQDDCTFPWFVYHNKARDKIICRLDVGVAEDIGRDQRAGQIFREALWERIFQQATPGQMRKSIEYLVTS